MAVLKYIISILLLFLFYENTQAQSYLWLAPTAEDIKTSKNNLWSGDLDNFDVDAEYALKLNAKEAGLSSLNLRHKGIGYKLDFSFTQNHNPSNSNCLIIDLIISTKGVISLVLGENGNSDKPKLIFTDTNKDIITLSECDFDISSNGTFDVSVSLINFPKIILFSIKENTENAWHSNEVDLSSIITSDFYTSDSIQFNFKYTSSRKQSYYLDKVKVYYDKPKVIDFTYHDKQFILYTNQQLLKRPDKIELLLNGQNTPIFDFMSNASVCTFNILEYLSYTDYSLQLKSLYSFNSTPLKDLDTLITITNPNPAYNDLKFFLFEITNNQFESIGLINNSEKAILLSDLILYLNGVQIPITTNDRVLKPKQKILITHKNELISNNNTIYFDESYSYKEESDISIQLNGIKLDSLHTNKYWFNNRNEYSSIIRKHLSGSSSDYSNWRLSNELLNNESIQDLEFLEDKEKPFLKYALIENDSIICVFNEFIKTSSNTSLIINDVNQQATYNSNNNMISIHVDTALLFNRFELLSVSDLNNNITDIESHITKKAISNSILINEILADPLQDETDNIVDQIEFIELYNPNSYNIDLSNCFLSKGFVEGHWLSSKKIYSIETASYLERPIIAAKSYFILYADKQKLFKDSFFYNLNPEFDSTLFYNFGGSSLSLTNESATICLVNAQDDIIDSLTYNLDFHNPHLIEYKGISMERVTSEYSGFKQSDNWTSCTAKNGITPLALNSNSIIENAESSIEETQPFCINLNSPIIYKHSSLYPNLLEIEVRSKEIEQFLTLNIYDRNGRLIKKLASQQSIGQVSHFIWNGLDQYNHKLAEGFYIIYAKIKSGKNQSEKIIQKSVVLAH